MKVEKLTKDFIDEIINIQRKLEEMRYEVERHYSNLRSWELDNLGYSKLRDIMGDVVDICITKDNQVSIQAIDSYDGNYDSNYYYCPLNKLISDEWKEEALKQHKEALEKNKEKQRLKKEARAKEIEANERAEYERLKAKFEKSNS